MTNPQYVMPIEHRLIVAETAAEQLRRSLCLQIELTKAWKAAALAGPLFPIDEHTTDEGKRHDQ